MSIIILIIFIFIIFILYILFGPYLIKIKCAFQDTNFNFLLNLSSFLNLFRLRFTIEQNRTNLDFIIFRQKISLNRFMQKKSQSKKPVEKITKSLGNFKKVIKRKNIISINKIISIFDWKHSQIKLNFGSSDPYLTGIVSAWVLPLTIHSDFIDFRPEFEEQKYKFLAEVLLPIVVYKIIFLFLWITIRSSLTKIKEKSI